MKKFRFELGLVFGQIYFAQPALIQTVETFNVCLSIA